MEPYTKINTQTGQMTSTVETWLPLFPGFYQTIFEPDESNEIDHINEVRADKGLPEIDYSDCQWNYNEVYDDVGIYACAFIERELSGLIEKVEYQHINSPREYNFKNDEIACKITVDVMAVRSFLQQHHNDWRDYLKDRYTSCSGFISFYPNYPEAQQWDIEKIVTETHQLGAFLNFAAEVEGLTVDDMYYSMEGNVAQPMATNYDELTGQ